MAAFLGAASADRTYNRTFLVNAVFLLVYIVTKDKTTFQSLKILSNCFGVLYAFKRINPLLQLDFMDRSVSLVLPPTQPSALFNTWWVSVGSKISLRCSNWVLSTMKAIAYVYLCRFSLLICHPSCISHVLLCLPNKGRHQSLNL